MGTGLQTACTALRCLLLFQYTAAAGRSKRLTLPLKRKSGILWKDTCEKQEKKNLKKTERKENQKGKTEESDMTHGERAEELFKKGYNCAQAVTAAFAEDMGMDLDTAARMASSFGGGVGRLREICGCVSGMALVAGILYGYSDPEDTEGKAELYSLVQELSGEFRKKHGEIICRNLLAGITSDSSPVPEARTEAYYQVRPCAGFAASAAEILEKKMKEREKSPEEV